MRAVLVRVFLVFCLVAGLAVPPAAMAAGPASDAADRHPDGVITPFLPDSRGAMASDPHPDPATLPPGYGRGADNARSGTPLPTDTITCRVFATGHLTARGPPAVAG